MENTNSSYRIEMRETFEGWSARQRVIKRRKPYPQYLLDIFRKTVTMNPAERYKINVNQFTHAADLWTNGTDADRQLIKDNWTNINTWLNWS